MKINVGDLRMKDLGKICVHYNDCNACPLYETQLCAVKIMDVKSEKKLDMISGTIELDDAIALEPVKPYKSHKCKTADDKFEQLRVDIPEQTPEQKYLAMLNEGIALKRKTRDAKILLNGTYGWRIWTDTDSGTITTVPDYISAVRPFDIAPAVHADDEDWMTESCEFRPKTDGDEEWIARELPGDGVI